MSIQALRSNGNTCTEIAFAKVNLGLKVLSHRQDGYHDLASVFQTVSLGDRVLLEPTAQLALSCSDAALPAGPGNLAWRAAELYLREVGGRPCRIHLEKAIPVAAGLGGGSADAAAVLRGLDRLASRPAGRRSLLELAVRLGSDVPFGLSGGAALAEGRGERLLPLAWDGGPFWCLLVFPPEPVSTAWAFAELDRTRRGDALSKPSAYLTFLDSVRGGRVDADGLWRVLENDFQPVIERAKPIVARASQLLAATGPLARSMSGSGSTVYGIYDDRTAADRAAHRLRTAGFPVFLCTPVPAPPA